MVNGDKFSELTPGTSAASEKHRGGALDLGFFNNTSLCYIYQCSFLCKRLAFIEVEACVKENDPWVRTLGMY